MRVCEREREKEREKEREIVRKRERDSEKEREREVGRIVFDKHQIMQFQIGGFEKEGRKRG